MNPSTADNTDERARARTDTGPELPWRGGPTAIAPLGPALRALATGKPATWVTDAGERGRCGLGFVAREGVRYVLFRGLDLAARLMARVLAGRAPEVIGTASRPGATVFVVAVLPDLSHTFIYREILALLRQSPDSRAVFLSHGENAPIHPEAVDLRAIAHGVPRRGILARYLSVFRWMLRAPLRFGHLVGLYRDRRGGTADDLLGKGPLRDALHPGAGFALADTITAWKPGHIHVYGSTYPANVAMEAACLLDVPFSISSYVDFDFAYDFKMLDRKMQLARFFRVCTGFCKTRLAEILDLPEQARIPVLFWGLDLGRWPARTPPSPSGRLLTAARIVPKKGLHLLPPALAQLAARGIPFEWRVCGDGPELPRLKELVAEHDLQDSVTFMGPVGNDVVRHELQAADLAILPCVVAADGERDGMPIFLTEAMALGVPVMATPVSGIPEVVRDGDTGYLVPPGDHEALAARLAEVLADRDGRARVAARGRDEIFTTHDVEHSARSILELIAAEGSQ